MTVQRWVLRNRFTGELYKCYPRRVEELYSSKKEAYSARLRGSLYVFQPTKVELFVQEKT